MYLFFELKGMASTLGWLFCRSVQLRADWESESLKRRMAQSVALPIVEDVAPLQRHAALRSVSSAASGTTLSALSASSPPMDKWRTFMQYSVMVPVLSLRMMDVHPRVSTEES